MFLRSCAAKNNALGVKGRKKKEVRREGQWGGGGATIVPRREILCAKLDPDKGGF